MMRTAPVPSTLQLPSGHLLAVLHGGGTFIDAEAMKPAVVSRGSEAAASSSPVICPQIAATPLVRGDALVNAFRTLTGNVAPSDLLRAPLFAQRQLRSVPGWIRHLGYFNAAWVSHSTVKSAARAAAC